jgi:lipooligosaccharide transport system permease protein
MNSTKIVQRNLLIFWRAWRWSAFLSVLAPTLFLTAMGWGLGSMVNSDAQSFEGAGYLSFFATGMLAASAMQSGLFQATYPILSRIVWGRNYEAVLATPMNVTDIFVGEMLSIALTLAQQTIPFFAVMALFGIFDSVVAIAAIPAAILLGMGAAAATAALTATLQRDEAYTWLFRFILTPLFLLSGTFFPIASLPDWARIIAQFTPLYHGIELVRHVTIFDFELLPAAGHLLYLIAFLGMGGAIALRNFRRRLIV